jgi:hypothetical protein
MAQLEGVIFRGRFRDDGKAMSSPGFEASPHIEACPYFFRSCRAALRPFLAKLKIIPGARVVVAAWDPLPLPCYNK